MGSRKFLLKQREVAEALLLGEIHSSVGGFVSINGSIAEVYCYAVTHKKLHSCTAVVVFLHAPPWIAFLIDTDKTEIRTPHRTIICLASCLTINKQQYFQI